MIHVEKITFLKKELQPYLQERTVQNRLKRIVRSDGHFMLFTGKNTMAKRAALSFMANTFRLEVRRIDLSQVVNKYIGETEKNISRILQRAENKGYILFFDEADALYGRRSVGKDADDRYVDIVAYITSHLDGFDGLVILSQHRTRRPVTEIKNKFDAIIHFPFSKK